MMMIDPHFLTGSLDLRKVKEGEEGKGIPDSQFPEKEEAQERKGIIFLVT